MYGVDVKEGGGGGRGLDLNVHWTLKNFFFDLSTPPPPLKIKIELLLSDCLRKNLNNGI